ncbi:amidophosphoribosyltransferase [Candidatus Peregrinibacteria bacterium CG_4_10_14_0_2_um_filter_43_11]|nr:MAG: amidophosphoribosyltransferase [Candidatus Peregrinibacteria bacterium CG_4_10_14_0_2_um_filter_43_11]
MCGFVGIYGNEDVAPQVYDSLIALQHRGQDAAGICSYDSHTFHLKKGMGLVRDIFHEGNMVRLKGQMGIGHVRYPTIGGYGIEDAQPFISHSPFGIAMAHNGNVFNSWELKEDLFKNDHCLVGSSCDVEVILNLFRSALLKQKIKNKLTFENMCKAAKSVFERAKGAYTVVGIIAGHGMIAFRDPHAIRPGIIGIRRGGMKDEYIIASEKIALDILGFEVLRDLAPGEFIHIDVEHELHSKIVMKRSYSPCIFEYVYLARPDSVIDKISVYNARLRMGKKLGKRIKKLNWDIDVVIPVPDSSRPAAVGVSDVLKIKYREGLVKNRYIGRTFIMPGQAIRQKSIHYKLNPIEYEIKGRNVLLVDDSIVRGNTSEKIVKMLRKTGAKKIYFASAAPELRNPCLYGIDMPERESFIANQLTVEQIREKINVDGLIYQTMEDLRDCVVPYNKKMTPCGACMDGKYVTGDIDEDVLAQADNLRSCGGMGAQQSDQMKLI